MSTKTVSVMSRNKPYYSKRQIRQLISVNSVQITEQARTTAQKDFGWSIDDICKTLLKLPVKSWYKSETKFNNPNIWVDYYRAHNLEGENIYTHFYIDCNNLVIDSFKEI
jgi:hypothetical protein